MNESRNTNAPMSITVLCACLGLLIIGVPAQGSVRRAATEAAQYGTSSTHLRLAVSAVSSLRVLKIDDRWLPDAVALDEGQAAEIFYQNTTALTDNSQVLLITHLPRAALSEQPAKPQAAI